MHFKVINKIILPIFIGLSNPVLAEGSLDTYQNETNPAVFELEGIDGKIYRLSDYKGKVVLVNFWTSWCPPCIHEIPSMHHLNNRFLNRPFDIVAINVAEQKKKVKYQAKLNMITFTVLLDPESKTFKQWQAKIFPTSFIVDKKGRIRYLVQGALEWDSDEVSETIEKLLIE